MHHCINGFLDDTQCLINISHAQLWEFEMIMHDTYSNIWSPKYQIKINNNGALIFEARFHYNQ